MSEAAKVEKKRGAASKEIADDHEKPSPKPKGETYTEEQALPLWFDADAPHLLRIADENSQ